MKNRGKTRRYHVKSLKSMLLAASISAALFVSGLFLSWYSQKSYTAGHGKKHAITQTNTTTFATHNANATDKNNLETIIYALHIKDETNLPSKLRNIKPSETAILALNPTSNSIEDDVLITKRSDFIQALVAHKNFLYYTSENKIFQTKIVNGTSTNKVVAERLDFVRAIAMRDNCLYDAGDYRQVFQTTDKNGLPVNKVIAERPFSVLTLVAYNNYLYDAGLGRKIFQTTDKNGLPANKLIAKRPIRIIELAVYNNCLYDAVPYDGISQTTDQSGSPINKSIIRGCATNLTEYNNQLYVLNRDKIFQIKPQDGTPMTELITEKNNDFTALVVYNNCLYAAEGGQILKIIARNGAIVNRAVRNDLPGCVITMTVMNYSFEKISATFPKGKIQSF